MLAARRLVRTIGIPLAASVTARDDAEITQILAEHQDSKLSVVRIFPALDNWANRVRQVSGDGALRSRSGDCSGPCVMGPLLHISGCIIAHLYNTSSMHQHVPSLLCAIALLQSSRYISPPYCHRKFKILKRDRSLPSVAKPSALFPNYSLCFYVQG